MKAVVSLFRGINVGGNHQVRMDELKALHEALGLRDVLPYIQSGNVVFQTDAADLADLRRQIEEDFAARFGFQSAVFLRTSAELQAIIDRNPFAGQENKASKWLVVVFLASPPDASAQDALLQAYAGPEEIFISGQEAYIYYPEGMGRSKLTGSLLEKKLKTLGTARNWNTVLELQKRLRALDSGGQ
jgi:uncharacterized protein (DUF1697 family)